MTFAVMPMKPPGAGKTRLAAGLDGATRQELALAMFHDSLEAASSCMNLDSIIVVTSDPTCRHVARELGATVLEDPGLDGHSAAAAFGAEAAIRSGAGSVLLIPGDCPALDTDEVDALIERERPPQCCLVVPDRHGTGTNALLLEPPDAIAPSFGPGSHDRHLDLATAAGVHGESAAVPSLAFDVDTPDDLTAMAGHLAERPGAAPRTAALLEPILPARER